MEKSLKDYVSGGGKSEMKSDGNMEDPTEAIKIDLKRRIADLGRIIAGYSKHDKS
jgi:hypothetical protein